MAGVATKLRQKLKVDRPAAKIREELREFQRLHTRDHAGFREDAHAAVTDFVQEANVRLASIMRQFCQRPGALFDSSLEAKAAALAVFASEAFEKELRSAIDFDGVTASFRSWSPLSRAEYDARVAELERELAKVAVAGELDEVEHLEAEARERREQLEARAAEVVGP
jgi:hypothetical protein